jgi:transposase
LTEAASPWFAAGMANVLSEEKRQQILALGRLGWSLRRIEDATGVRRETASAYLKAARIGVRAPRMRRPPKPASQVSTDSGVPSKPASQVSTDSGVPSKPASQVSTDSGVPSKPASQVSTDPGRLERPGRAPSASACEPYQELVEIALERGRNAMAIWQELVDEHGFAHGYASVRRFVGKLRGRRPREACAVIVTEPGQEGQVDYGTGPMVRHPGTGKYRRTRLFVLTLGYSRKSVRLLTFRSSTRIWAELHERAFRRLGGCPRVLVPDNLREGVVTADVYDPQINSLYRDMLAHYGVVALPCRVGHPDRKGKVESGVGHAKRTPLKGLRFESLERAQAYLDHWEERWADTRIHGTTKRQVRTMFAEERPSLLPLPAEPFRYYEYGTRTVHLDGCVEVQGAYYGAPPGFIGVEVPVQWDRLHVRILHPRTRQLLREHLRERPGRYRIKPEDRPTRTPPTTVRLLGRAARAGRHVGSLCKTIHERDGELGVRRVLGMLSLVKKHGASRVDDACSAALEMGVPEYRFVRRFLERVTQPPLPLRQVDPLIRELAHYRDLINRMSEGDPA